MFKVVNKFYDLKDNNHCYYVGDKFPHNGKKVSDKRIAELSSNKNKMGIPLIEEIPEKPVKKATKKTVEETEE
jgi:hypothetical protein